MSTISLGISGAAGRMGKRLIALAAEQPDLFKLTTAIDAPQSTGSWARMRERLPERILRAWR